MTVPCTGPMGTPGGKGDPGAMGAQGAPGAPATTNDHFMFNPKGQLEGVVYDQYDRRPITGARVSIAYNGMVQTITTDATGLYNFKDLPANSGMVATHGVGGGADPVAWVGAYTLTLDLSMVQDADHHYRSYQERRANVVFTALADGESPGGSDQNTDTQVDGLVANLDFPVRQTRGSVQGNVYNVETRIPMADFGLVFTYTFAGADLGSGLACPGSAILGQSGIDQDFANQVGASGMTDAMGHFMTSGMEEGVCYILKPADDSYTFVQGGNNPGMGGVGNSVYLAGTPIYASENGVVRSLPDVLVQHTVGRDNVPPYVVSASPADNQVLLAGAALDQNVTLTFSEAMDQTQPVLLTTHTYWGLNQGFNLTGTSGTGAGPATRATPCAVFGPITAAQAGTPVQTAAPPAGGGANSWGPVGVSRATGQCTTLLEVFTINSWDATGKVLTVDPQVNFVPGLAFGYRVDAINFLLRDVAGNPRTGCLPASSTQRAGDALATQSPPTTAANCPAAGPGGNAPDSLYFSFQAGTNALTVNTCSTDPMTGVRSGLCQELDTADTQGTPTAPTALTVRSRDTTFRGLLGAGLYTATTVALAGAAPTSTQDAYVRWDPVAGAVSYVVYYKDTFYPNYLPLQLLVPTQAPQRVAFNISLGQLNTALEAIYGAPPTGFVDLDKSWITGRTGAGLHFQIGVSAVNIDGVEGPITDVDIQDTTTPQVATNFIDGVAGLGGDFHFSTGLAATAPEAAAGNLADGIVLNDEMNKNCGGGDIVVPPGSVSGVGRLACFSAPQAAYGNLTAAAYGQRTIVIELSEPVPVGQLVPANLQIVSGFVRNVSGNTMDVNGTELDATIVAAGPVFVGIAPGPFTKWLGVTVDNIFRIDSGDVILLNTATGGVADVAGNVANPARSSRFTGNDPVNDPNATGFRFIDAMSPMLRSVTMDGTANTVTLAFTKKIFQDTVCTSGSVDPDCATRIGAGLQPDNASTNNGPVSNYDRENVSFQNSLGIPALPAPLGPAPAGKAFFPNTAFAASARGTLTTYGIQTYSAVLASNPAGDVVTYSFADISRMQNGGTILLQGIRNIDWYKGNTQDDSRRQLLGLPTVATSRVPNFSDRGTQAFSNQQADRFTGAAAGAYNPNAMTSVGVDTMTDTIGPRFSNVDIDNNTGTGSTMSHRSANLGLAAGALANGSAAVTGDPAAVQNFPGAQPTVFSAASTFPAGGVGQSFTTDSADITIGSTQSVGVPGVVRIASGTGSQLDMGAINSAFGAAGNNLLGRQVTVAGFGTNNAGDPSTDATFNGTFTIVGVNNGASGGMRSIDMANAVPVTATQCTISALGCINGNRGTAAGVPAHSYLILVPAVFPKANEWAVACQTGAGTTRLSANGNNTPASWVTGPQVTVHLTERTGANAAIGSVCNTGDATCGSCNTDADCAAKWQLSMTTFGGCIGAASNGAICQTVSASFGGSAIGYPIGGAPCTSCEGVGFIQGTGNTSGTNVTPLSAVVRNVNCVDDTAAVDSAGVPTGAANNGELCTISFDVVSTQSGGADNGCGSNGITARGGGISSITMGAAIADARGNVASNRVLNFTSGTAGRNGTVAGVSIRSIGWVRP